MGTQYCNGNGTAFEPCVQCTPVLNCTPGTTMSCACPSGASGTMTCASDGSGYGACAPCTTSACGDGQCGAGETCASCASDCGCAGGRVCQGGSCVVASGCSGGCGRGYRCNAANACELDPSSFWVLALRTGTIATMAPEGGAWDPFGGAPDPTVCIEINGENRCSMSTSATTDTFAPNWNTAWPATTAGALQAGVLFDAFDLDDASGNDPICTRGLLPFAAERFDDGGGTITCGQYASISYTLTPQ